MDLSAMTNTELKAIRDEANQLLRKIEQEAIAELETRAAALGFQVMKPNGGHKPAKPTVKYRDAEGNTWTGGRGRKPAWVTALIERGDNIEDYRT